MPPNTLIFKRHKCIYKQTGTGNNTFLKGTDKNKARIKICIDLVQYSVQVIISHISKTLESQWCLLCDSASGFFYEAAVKLWLLMFCLWGFSLGLDIIHLAFCSDSVLVCAFARPTVIYNSLKGGMSHFVTTFTRSCSTLAHYWKELYSVWISKAQDHCEIFWQLANM